MVFKNWSKTMSWKDFFGFVVMFLLALFCLFINDRNICETKAESYGMNYTFSLKNGCHLYLREIHND